MKKPDMLQQFDEIQEREQCPVMRQNNDDVFRALLRTKSTGKIADEYKSTATAFHMWVYI